MLLRNVFTLLFGAVRLRIAQQLRTRVLDPYFLYINACYWANYLTVVYLSVLIYEIVPNL